MANKTTLTFQFDGAGVNIPGFGGDFVPLVTNVYSLVQACSTEEVQIEGIENNCIKFVLAATLLGATLSLADGGVADAAKFNTAARGINAAMKKHNASMEVRWGDEGEVFRFDGSREIPVVPEGQCDVKTTMSIYGELINVGGVSPNAHIRSEAFEKPVVLALDRDDAKKLAQRLYWQVGVLAFVTIRNGDVIKGKVVEVLDYAPEDMAEWLRKNSGALGIEAFRGMDIAQFIAEQRG